MGVQQILNDLALNSGGNADVDVLKITNTILFIEEYLGLFLGVIIIVLILGMAVITAIDGVFITMPVTRESIQELNKRSKVRFLSKDAINSVAKHYNGDSRSIVSIYIGSRIKTYLLVGMVIAIVTTNTWDILIAYLSEYISRIIIHLML